MILSILGRQAAISMAELEALFGADHVDWFGKEAALINTDNFDIERVGGSIKAGTVIEEFDNKDWNELSKIIIQHYFQKWKNIDYKITLGISVYNNKIGPKAVQKIGIQLKQQLKQQGVSLRLIPNYSSAHNSAVSHHNKLGLSTNKVELLIVTSGDRTILAESTGAQNITDLAARDQSRPKRDAFVGMLPPKLARTMINLAEFQQNQPSEITVLDPFCGTGVVLQEANLLGYSATGTDLNPKMVSYSQENLEWLHRRYKIDQAFFDIAEADAMTHRWDRQINRVVSETYLGQPFSAPPSPKKLQEVRKNCNYIISSFLKNTAKQIKPGTPLCLAVPAWISQNSTFTSLPLVDNLHELGFETHQFKNVSNIDLIYRRPDQIVGRQLLVMSKK